MCFRKSPGCFEEKLPQPKPQRKARLWGGVSEGVIGSSQFWSSLRGRIYSSWKQTGHGD